MRILRSLISDRSGATAIEYGLMVALLSVMSIGGFMAASSGIQNVWQSAIDQYTDATGTPAGTADGG